MKKMKKMKITHSHIELLQRIEFSIDSALRSLEHMQTGNFAHGKNSTIGVLLGCKDTWIKKLKKLLEEDEE